MSIKSGKKLGFFAAITMLVGTVVGIGIFFKSHGILRANDWNGTGTFIAWLLGGLLSLAAAISFSEIGSMKTSKVHGLAAWAEKLGGKRFGYFVRFNFSFFYIGMLTAVLGVFGSEMLFNMIATFDESHSMKDFPVYAHIILGLAFSVSFLLLNYFSIKGGGLVQQVTTILKWAPLLIVAFAGLILATTNNAGPAQRLPLYIKEHGNADGFNPLFGQSAFTNGTSFKFTAMLSALPAVLFAFDAFINVASMRNKLKDENKLPAIVIIGMVSVVVLYLLIALSAILHGSGMVSGAPFGAPPIAGIGIFDQVFGASTAEAMGKFVVVFLLISTLGVINGISAAAVSIHEQAILTNTIFGAKTATKRFGHRKTLIGYSLFVIIFWTLVFGIPASILNSDSIVDGVSNFPTLFFFAIYGTVILLYTIKRNKQDTKKINNILFNIAAWTAIIGIFFVVAYQFLYGFTIAALQDPKETLHWGLFAGDSHTDLKLLTPSRADADFGVYMNRFQGFLVFISFFMMFITFPKWNRKLSGHFESNDVIIDTQA